MRFWAFSYSMGEPCGRSNQLITYFMVLLLGLKKGAENRLNDGFWNGQTDAHLDRPSHLAADGMSIGMMF